MMLGITITLIIISVRIMAAIDFLPPNNLVKWVNTGNKAIEITAPQINIKIKGFRMSIHQVNNKNSKPNRIRVSTIFSK
jgi:hypothetical protein